MKSVTGLMVVLVLAGLLAVGAYFAVKHLGKRNPLPGVPGNSVKILPAKSKALNSDQRLIEEYMRLHAHNPDVFEIVKFSPRGMNISGMYEKQRDYSQPPPASVYKPIGNGNLYSVIYRDTNPAFGAQYNMTTYYSVDDRGNVEHQSYKTLYKKIDNDQYKEVDSIEDFFWKK